MGPSPSLYLPDLNEYKSKQLGSDNGRKLRDTHLARVSEYSI